jgi:sulfur-carrier protein
VARLRLFGKIAELAGVARDEIPGRSVEEVFDAAGARYGVAFIEGSRTCRVWVNGRDPEPGMSLNDDDEVALLPPVSGG